MPDGGGGGANSSGFENGEVGVSGFCFAEQSWLGGGNRFAGCWDVALLDGVSGTENRDLSGRFSVIIGAGFFSIPAKGSVVKRD